MSNEIDAVDQYGNRYKARRVSGGDGCFSNLGCLIMVLFGIIFIGIGISQSIGDSFNNLFSPYHAFTPDHKDAVRAAVKNYVGSGVYIGLFETDASSDGLYLSKNDPHFSNVSLASDLGGFPGKSYTVDSAAASYMFEFDNVNVQREGHCLLVVYINSTPHISHTVQAQFSDTGDKIYTIHIKPGEDSGSVDIGTQGKDQYSYTAYIQGDVGTPFEAIVVKPS